jgi:menaquinone-dependent protoporphyrinogen oxidase
VEKPILVAFAEAVADAIRELQQNVEVMPLRDVRSLEGYSAVVVGAPLYMFRWHKDAVAFLTRFRDALVGMPLAVFALGPFNDIEREWTEVRGQLDKELAKFPWLRTFDIKIVGGKFDAALLRFPYTLLPALKKLPAADIRDWRDIAEWGRKVSALFSPQEN